MKSEGKFDSSGSQKCQHAFSTLVDLVKVSTISNALVLIVIVIIIIAVIIIIVIVMVTWSWGRG